jgi:transposase
VPDRPQRELRELTRYRTSLVRARTAEANRLQKTLEGANVKLGLVATDVLGKTGRDILAALVAGETDPAALAELARGLLRKKRPQLEQALTADVGLHQRFLLAQHLAHIDFLEAAIAAVSAEVARRLRPLDEAITRLDTIPGIGREAAEALLAELGGDVARFPTAKHLASWAGMCPGSYESAGKHKGGKTRKGNKWLRRALVEAACAAARNKATYLAARYRRLLVRRGKRRAAVAVGHTLLCLVYALLADGEVYREPGPAYLDDRQRRRIEQRALDQLRALGYEVSLAPRPAAA